MIDRQHSSVKTISFLTEKREKKEKRKEKNYKICVPLDKTHLKANCST